MFNDIKGEKAMKYYHKRNRKTNKDVQRENRKAERDIMCLCNELGVDGFIGLAQGDKVLRQTGLLINTY